MKITYQVLTVVALVLLALTFTSIPATASPPLNGHATVGPTRDWNCFWCVLLCGPNPLLPDCQPDGVCGFLAYNACFPGGGQHLSALPVRRDAYTLLATRYGNTPTPTLSASSRSVETVRYTLRE